MQRIAEPRLLQEADVVFAHLQGGGAAGGEGLHQAKRAGQAHQALHGVGDIEAHVEVPHLVALPGVDAPAPDLDAALEHGVESLCGRGFRRPL